MASLAPHKIHKHPALRKWVLPIVKALSPGNIRIRHHFTGRRFKLHFWRHKGYWYHGKRREAETMDFFQQALKPGETAIEVGGHIGYIATYLAQLAGDAGRLIVFEPGSNNLEYIRGNLDGFSNAQLVEKAVSDQDGVAEFFEETLTGQNNSLVGDYELFEKNRDQAYSDTTYRKREVPTIRLDTFATENPVDPVLIKIDVEGAELQVLKGGLQLIGRSKPAIVVEVTNDRQAVCDWLTSQGYSLFDEYGQPADPCRRLYNVFALQPGKHDALIRHIDKS